jgi:hypothetical protein
LVNEELDPKLIINRLRKEVETLKNQLAIGNNPEISGDLSPDEIEKYKKQFPPISLSLSGRLKYYFLLVD